MLWFVVHRCARLYRGWRSAALVGMLLATVTLCGPAGAQTPTATDKVRFYFNISYGNARGAVDIELFGNESPLHVANFFDYLDDDEYDDSFIHRTRSVNQFGVPTAYFVQGGSYRVPADQFINSNPIEPREPVVNEFDPNNGLSNTPGTLAAARTADPDSATSGWFINVSNNADGFDAGPYTVFGQVTHGMALVSEVPFLPNNVIFEGTNFESMPLVNGTTLVVIVKADRIGLVDGDYNLDGIVDHADHQTWQDAFGQNVLVDANFASAADGNRDGLINAADFTVWQDNLGRQAPAGGTGLGSGSVVATPEPTAAVLWLVAGAPWLAASRSLRRRKPSGHVY